MAQVSPNFNSALHSGLFFSIATSLVKTSHNSLCQRNSFANPINPIIWDLNPQRFGEPCFFCFPSILETFSPNHPPRAAFFLKVSRYPPSPRKGGGVPPGPLPPLAPPGGSPPPDPPHLNPFGSRQRRFFVVVQKCVMAFLLDPYFWVLRVSPPSGSPLPRRTYGAYSS